MSLSLIPTSVLHRNCKVHPIEQHNIIVPGEWVVLLEFSKQFHSFFQESIFYDQKPYPLLETRVILRDENDNIFLRVNSLVEFLKQERIDSI